MEKQTKLNSTSFHLCLMFLTQMGFELKKGKSKSDLFKGIGKYCIPKD